jgi:hypothetical protein
VTKGEGRAMAAADVRFEDGLWIITISKGLVVLTESQLVDGLRRGKWYQRRHAKRARIPRVDERISPSTCAPEKLVSRGFNRDS